MGCSSSNVVSKLEDQDYSYYILLRTVVDLIFASFKDKGINIYNNIIDKRDSIVDSNSHQTDKALFLCCSFKYRIPTVLWTKWGRWEFAEIKDNTPLDKKENKNIMDDIGNKITMVLCKPYVSVYNIIKVGNSELPEENVAKYLKNPEEALNIWKRMKEKYELSGEVKKSPASTATTINSTKSTSRSEYMDNPIIDQPLFTVQLSKNDRRKSEFLKKNSSDSEKESKRIKVRYKSDYEASRKTMKEKKGNTSLSIPDNSNLSTIVI